MRTAAPACFWGRRAFVNEYDWDGHTFRLTLEHGDWATRITLRQYEIKQ